MDQAHASAPERRAAAGVAAVPLPPLIPPPLTDESGFDLTPEVKRASLIIPDPVLREDLRQQILQSGYLVDAFAEVESAIEAARTNYPDVIVVDIGSGEGNLAMAVAEIQHISYRSAPLLILSDRREIETRLMAVRFGARSYLTKPTDTNALVSALDNLTDYRLEEPYRVLVVEPDEKIAREHASILRRAGMTVEISNAALSVLDDIAEYNPEVIIMNLYFPDCLGMELAAVIRQDQANQSIPIVFLSRESNLDRQTAALLRGGDDFLEHPVEPDRLVSSVSVRVERARTISSFMVRDSMTGLLNHSSTRQKIASWILNCRKKSIPFSFALIDIDKFKKVNDVHGHPAGDRVIQSRARHLRHRTRKTDIVGRYGGEEFAVLLAGLDGPGSVRVMNRIREGFSNVRQRSDIGEFFTTFSCGIASFPDYQDAEGLNVAADRALYAAKRSGGNKVGRIIPRKEAPMALENPAAGAGPGYVS
ncbi:MAG: diguanylate cyclase [Spirochaetia bacterium]|nr:diguanylate cyclase [Spirochaetia bacterium]